MALALVQKYINTRQPIYLHQAQQFVREAQSRNPDSTQVLLAAGYVSEAGGQWNKALQAYRRIEELDARNVDVQQRLAHVYEQLEEPGEAVAAFRRAQELDPQYYRSYYMMGQFYVGQGRYQEAVEQFGKAVALAPGFYDGYSRLGGVLAELGRFPEAENALRRSQAIRETPQALNNLGAVLVFQGRYEEAAAYQEKALVYQPKGALLLLLLTNIADNLRLAGQKSEAMAYYRRALDEALAELAAESKAADVRGTFAYICARLGDRVRAEQEIKQAINSAPDDSDVLRSAVVTYEALGHRGLAIEASRGISAAQLKHLIREPDLADFSRDPRFMQQMIDKGGQ
jgi:tetratricopeptide (TPR) repeat protein